MSVGDRQLHRLRFHHRRFAIGDADREPCSATGGFTDPDQDGYRRRDPDRNADSLRSCEPVTSGRDLSIDDSDSHCCRDIHWYAVHHHKGGHARNHSDGLRNEQRDCYVNGDTDEQCHRNTLRLRSSRSVSASGHV